MQPFHNILAGIDLTQFDATTHQPSAVAREVIHRALWLADKSSARLTFFSALNLTRENLPHLEEADRHSVAKAAETAADKILGGLVEQARGQGIEAAYKMTLGRAWWELISQVLRDKHDLLLVGTRDRKGLGRMLFGSTAIKLIRRCPCPVWVSKPSGDSTPLKILVASDLKAISEIALRMAVQLSQIAPRKIHLLHVVDFPLDRIWCTGLPDVKDQQYRQDVRRKAEQTLQDLIDRAGARSLTPPVEVHLVDDPGGLPDEGILQFIRTHQIDLLIMGTIGRGGMLGVMIGNTAERILPELSCSLLAVKPADFVSPVRI